jgi:hypothetical protein
MVSFWLIKIRLKIAFDIYGLLEKVPFVGVLSVKAMSIYFCYFLIQYMLKITCTCVGSILAEQFQGLRFQLFCEDKVM